MDTLRSLILPALLAPALVVGSLAVASPAAAWGHSNRDSGGEVQAQSVERPAPPEGSTTVFRPTLLYGFGGGADTQHGFGLDLRLRFYPGSDPIHVGVFGQGAYVTNETTRSVGGFTAGFGMFELELGIAHRTAGSGVGATTGLHIGKSITFGMVSVGGALTIPLVDHIETNTANPDRAQGIEGMFFVRLGFDLTLDGQRRGVMGRHSGRSCHGGGHGRR